MPRFWRRGRWLAGKNRYARDSVNKIKQDTAPAGHLRHSQLASYVAASSVIHCMDGWSYAARAIAAELSGDVDAARHLAYYAELRAAMSLLAVAGIGAFNDKHVAVRADGQCETIAGSRTHQFVWDALEYWAQQHAATDLVLRVIQPGGIELSRWLNHFAPAAGASFRAILASQWLLEWGLDLRRLALDREARNESSYRPTTITSRRRPTLNQRLNFVEHLWRAHEPFASSPFSSIDRYLLRRSFAYAFRVNDPQHRHPRQARGDFRRVLKPVLHAVTPTPGDLSSDQWERFLVFRAPYHENLVVAEAEKKDPVSSPFHHIQVIARAVVLLRVATGAARLNVKQLPPQDVGRLAFWWSPIGEDRGLWDAGAPPQQFADLWQDIDIALTELRDWRTGGGASRRTLFDSAPRVVQYLGSCERVALWGLGI